MVLLWLVLLGQKLTTDLVLCDLCIFNKENEKNLTTEDTESTEEG